MNHFYQGQVLFHYGAEGAFLCTFVRDSCGRAIVDVREPVLTDHRYRDMTLVDYSELRPVS